ncbi:MAG TPA: N-acetylmuramoyl-L-alanine amidase [Caulobacteraceae bacterium]|jgi:N-acetylmuramoyl-L-alanine amidase
MGLALRKVWIAFAFAALVAAAPLAHALADDVAPVDSPIAAGPFGVRFGGDETRTRLVLDLGDMSPGRVAAVKNDGRLELDLPSISQASGQGAGHGLVRRWAATADTEGARVSFELAPGVSIERRFAIPPSPEVAHWRYVVDLVAGDPLASLLGPRPVAAPGPTPVAPSPAPANHLAQADASRSQALAPRLYPFVDARPASPPPVRTVSAPVEALTPKVIVIDPGHGGHDTGAQSLVLNEKDINLASALALKARLERSGRYRVVLTRSDDTFIPLGDRVRIARAAKADLFISLHTDSAGQDPTPHGATVYTLSDHGVTRVNEVLGPHEWFAKAGDRRADPAVGQILLDLTQRSTLNRSAEFAGLLINHIGRNVDLVPRGHRDAGYYVLLAPDVPAVLLEMGFITNPADELRLTDPEQRRQMMDEVGDAIDQYFAPHAEVAEAGGAP